MTPQPSWPDGLDAVDVPAGRVYLHDKRTVRAWHTEVAAFCLGVAPVTEEQYADVTGRDYGSGLRAGFPVVEVSWWDAVSFCNALSERHGLEPVYDVDQACRAGTGGPRYGVIDEIAWYRENSSEHAHQVATKRPNPWGLYDMLGNVWEWCWDLYDPEAYGAYRILRGGGWSDPHWSVRASVRRRSHPTFRIDDVGFRVARSH